MKAVSFSNRAQIAPDVMIQEVGGESVLLDLKTERYLGLNEVGTRMWQVLSESESIQAAYETLQAEYDVTPEQLEEDLRNLIDRLLENVLITTEPRD
jgi:LmbE family N-acetylglucosaminyl deacetylase